MCYFLSAVFSYQILMVINIMSCISYLSKGNGFGVSFLLDKSNDLYVNPSFYWTAIPLRFEILVKMARIVAETAMAQ